MKFNKLFLGFLGAMAFTACSSDEPINNGGNDSSEDGARTNYVSVSIEMSAAPGSRALGNGSENYDQGTEAESKVDNIVFFFFDKDDKCIEIQRFDNPVFTDPIEPSDNPYISNYGIIEVPLKAVLSYSQVAVALNTPYSDEDLYLVTTHQQLEERMKNYVGAIKGDGSGQVMSNSIYFDMPDSKTKPTEGKKVCVIPISEKNIYTSAERKDIDELIQKREKEVVSIYVERVVARVDVTEATFDMTKYYTFKDKKDDGTEVELKTVPIFDPLVIGSSPIEEITVQPVITGMCLNVLTPQTQLMKPMLTDFGYTSGATGADAWRRFEWNDPANKRSYWANTRFLDEKNLKYNSWNDAVSQGPAAFQQYIHPNTQHFEPTTSNEGGSRNSKIMVSAVLCENGDPTKPIDLVRYGAEHMIASSLLTYTANRVNNAVRAIEWENLGYEATEAQLTAIKNGVHNAFVSGLAAQAFDYAIDDDNNDPNMPGSADWEARIVKSAKFALPTIEGVDGNLEESVIAQINKTINETLAAVNAPEILYWKDGKTYFFTNIRHQGFNGLAGNSTNANTKDYLFGVVRNHIYKISLDGIYGLGTPVIDPAKPIDPDRPDDGRPSYIKAQINILPWRVVTNSATIH